jgi:hypothetical protein
MKADEAFPTLDNQSDEEGGSMNDDDGAGPDGEIATKD